MTGNNSRPFGLLFTAYSLELSRNGYDIQFIAIVDKFWFSTQNPRNKFVETDSTFAEFIEEYVRGVQRTMDMLGNLIGVSPEQVAKGNFTYHAQYFHFLLQLVQYAPNAREKLRTLAENDYTYWRAAIHRAIDSGELRKDVNVEDAVVMFRQVYMGLSFEMSFLGDWIPKSSPDICVPFIPC